MVSQPIIFAIITRETNHQLKRFFPNLMGGGGSGEVINTIFVQICDFCDFFLTRVAAMEKYVPINTLSQYCS